LKTTDVIFCYSFQQDNVVGIKFFLDK